MWGTGTAPTGWLLCTGTAVSRSTYAALFAVIGTTFGSGDGSTTFNVPNYTNRTPYGTTVGATGGSADAVGPDGMPVNVVVPVTARFPPTVKLSPSAPVC